MKATKTNRFDQLVSGIKKIDKESRVKCNLSINKNTEAFLVTKLSDYLYKKFTTINYKLEVRPTEILEQLDFSNEDLTTYKQNKEWRLNGFLDSVLYYKNSKNHLKPAHIIEFKRGKRERSIFKDCLRLAVLVNAAQQSRQNKGKTTKHRLETAYFITTMVYPQNIDTEENKNSFNKNLKKVDEKISGEGQEVNMCYDIFKLGESKDGAIKKDKNVWAAIIEITPLQS